MGTIKKNIYLISLLMTGVFVIVLSGCNKGNLTATIPQGKYTGSFIYSYSITGYRSSHGVTPADITFANGNYITTNNLPAPGNGTYQLKTDSISFDWSKPVPLPLEGSLLVLLGTFQYHFEGDSLIITKYDPNSLAITQYRLKRN